MKKITFQRVVYVSDQKHYPYVIKYNDVKNELENETEVIMEFPKGDYNRRMKKIESLGYKLIDWIWEPNEGSPIYSLYKGLFIKAYM